MFPYDERAAVLEQCRQRSKKEGLALDSAVELWNYFVDKTREVDDGGGGCVEGEGVPLSCGTTLWARPEGGGREGGGEGGGPQNLHVLQTPTPSLIHSHPPLPLTVRRTCTWCCASVPSAALSGSGCASSRRLSTAAPSTGEGASGGVYAWGVAYRMGLHGGSQLAKYIPLHNAHPTTVCFGRTLY